LQTVIFYDLTTKVYWNIFYMFSSNLKRTYFCK